MKKIYLGILLLVAHVQLTFAQVYTADQINAIGNWDGFSSFSIQASPFTGVDGDKEKEHQLNGISWTNGDKLKAFSIFNPQATNPPMAERWLKPRSGTNLLLFNCNFGKDADNWIITPKVRLKSGTPKLEFYIQNYHTYWQRYQIWVSTTTNDVSSFKQISDGDYLEAAGSVPNNSTLAWKRISFDLSAYANQDVYIAIRHVTPGQGVMMAIDDLKIIYGKENVQLPIIDFIANKTTITAGETVTFTDQSSNTPTSWKWNFPGGSPSTSTSKNPTVTYAYPGIYNVELSATNPDGTSTKTKTGFITVNGKLKADFSAEKLEAYEGESISFNDFSLGTPSNWEWTFTGSSTPSSTQQNPVVKYLKSGTYDVKLKVSKGTDQDIIAKTAYIVIQPAAIPIVDFSANTTSVEEGGVVKFKDATTGGGLTYNWTLEGASPPVSNEINPEVTYYNEGTYKVTLTVSNAKGEDTFTKENYITVTQPEQDYCDASSRGEGGTRGITNVQIGTINNTTASNSYTYYNALQTTVERNGSYPLTVTVNGGFDVGTDGKGTKVVVWVDWNQDGDFRDVNEKVLVMNRDGDNNYNGTIKVPADAGRRKSRMRIRSFYSFENGDEQACGEEPEGEVEDYNLYINAADIKPIADFESNTQSVPSGAFVNFKDISQNNVTGWEWNFEGGTPIISYDRAPQIKYTTPGTYTVTLKVSNSAGSDTKVKTSYITVTQGDSNPTCTDGIQNGDETGIDCGGSSCEPCIVDSTCTDGIQNGDETGIDCGGSSCEPCAVTVEGAMVSTNDDKTEVTTITGDGVADLITFKNTSQSTANYEYLITDDTGKILTTESISHDFEGATVGICRVYGISYNGTLDVTGKNVSDLGLATGNHDISDNWITVIRKEQDPGPTCSDGIQNGDETGIDCGGTCEPCIVLTYCEAKSNDATSEYIGRFQLGTIDNTSTSNGGYSDFTTKSTNLAKDSKTSLIITPTWKSTVYNEAYVLWIDYNQDGDFEDAGELVFSKAASKDTSITGEFTVPTSAKSGNTRARVIMRYNTIPSPCGTFNYGEVEDYTIVIIDGTSTTCTDGIQNGDETGIDCGGSCDPCTTTNPGDVIYVDIEDKTVNASNTWSPFPMEIGDSVYFGAWFSGNVLRLVNYNKDIVCEGTSSNATILPEGVEVGASSNFVVNPNSYVISSSEYTNWNGKSGYIGFSFKIAEKTHYGWLYATVSNDGSSYTVLDYAYHTKPGEGLLTTRNATLALKESNKRAVVFPNPFEKTVTIDASRLGGENLIMTVYNVLGKKVYEKVYPTNPGILSFGRATDPVGIYYVRLRSNGTSETHSILKK